MGRRYPCRLPICCAFFVCFVGSVFSIPLLEDIRLEQQRKLTERPVQNLQILDQLDHEKALYVTLELSSTAIRRACQEADDDQRETTAGRRARIPCHGFFDTIQQVAGLELPPDTPSEHNYQRQESSVFAGDRKSDADIRSTSISHSPQPLNSQSMNFFPATQVDLGRKGTKPSLLNIDGRRSGMSPARTRLNPEYFHSNSDSIERPARQLKFGAFHSDYETLRDPRQIKFEALYPEYDATVGLDQRYPRQIKFESFQSGEEVLD